MRHALLSEWLKVRRAGILGTTAAITAVLSVTAVIVGLHELDRPRRKANVGLYSQADGIHAILAHSTDFLAIVGLGFAAFAFSTEFSSGTLRNLLVRQPRRLTLFAGKSVVIAALITAVVLLAYFVAYPAALVTAPHYGVSTSLWTTPAGVRALLAGAGDLVLSTLGYSILGALLGVLLRSPAPAIVAGLAYVFAVEGLLTNSFASLSSVLFASQLDAISHGGTADVGYGSALIVAAAWAIGLIVVGALELRRRDIAA
jgi:ABC-type transport system involved in multi-copper enzyme maturation permease subunit